jgi:hypothetical protein
LNHRERLLREADAAGFTEEGIALGRSVLEALSSQAAAGGLIYPQSAGAEEVMRLLSRAIPVEAGFWQARWNPPTESTPRARIMRHSGR